MRIPRLRFTVRRMMVAVAIAAIVMGGLAERHYRFAKLSDHHLAALVALIPKVRASIAAGDDENPIHERGFWHAKMRAKYFRAARYPWLPVAPDPPEPK